MIKKDELLEAIAECQGQRNPNANTCFKLASYYTILDHIEEQRPTYSFATQTAGSEVKYMSDTEFGQKIYGMEVEDVLELMDELMTTLSIVNPRLYEGVMRKM